MQNTEKEKHIGLIFKQIHNKTIQRMHSCLAADDLTLSQLAVLDCIFENEKISVKDLEEEFSMQRSTTLGILKRMCCKGLIEYFPDEHDKRCRIIRPTKKAYDLKKKTDEHKQNLDILMLETLTKDEVNELRCLLNTVLSNLSKEV